MGYISFKVVNNFGTPTIPIHPLLIKPFKFIFQTLSLVFQIYGEGQGNLEHFQILPGFSFRRLPLMLAFEQYALKIL